MVELILNNKTIPVPVDFEMQVTINCPFWRFDKIPASYSVDFNIPVNEYTSAIFAHPERVTKFRTGNESKFTGFEIRGKGSRFVGGTLIVTTENGQYNCTFKDFVGELSDAQQQDSLLDLLAFAGEEDFQNSANYSPDTHKYACFPIINPGFFNDRGVKAKRSVYENGPEGQRPTGETYDIEVLSFCFNQSVQSRVNALNADNTIKQLTDVVNLTNLHEKNNTYSGCKVSVVSPFFFLGFVLKKALKEYGFSLSQNIFETDNALKNLVVYNNFDITKSGYVTIADQIEYYEGWVNPWEMEGMPTNVSVAGSRILGYSRNYAGKLSAKKHLPKMTIGEALLSTQNAVNVLFDFRPDGHVSVFSREDLLATEPVNIEKYLLSKILPGEQKLNAIHFIPEREQNDGVFKERFIDLNDRRKDIKAPVADWEELLLIENPEEGEIRLLTSLGKFVEYKWLTYEDQDPATSGIDSNDYLGWDECSITLQDGWVNFGQENVIEIKTKWSTCYSLGGNTLVNQPGNQDSWKSKKQDFSPRLLIYAGNNRGGNEVPELSLDYEKPGNGLIAKRWKNTVKVLANQLPLTMKLDLPVNALRSIIYNKCLPYRTNDATFIFDRLKFSIGTRRISTVEAEAFKI